VGSGKTTFLAALNFAAAQSQEKAMIYGTDDMSTEFLAESSWLLSQQFRFPDATQQVSSLDYTLSIPAQRGKDDLAPPALPTVFNITIRDAPGGYFFSEPLHPLASSRLDLGDGPPEASPDPVNMTDYLASCDGLIFLLDPVRQLALGDGYDYLGDTLLRIAQRCADNGRTGDGWLPHYLAVCVTKFDHPEVYQRARDAGFCCRCTDDPHRCPHVHAEKAEAFFANLCKEGNDGLIHETITRYFHPGRVRYFVTSSIGFYLASETASFDEQDYVNVIDADGSVRLRGNVHPINIIEPILWLGRCLTTIEG
jgi:hypothetical protein